MAAAVGMNEQSLALQEKEPMHSACLGCGPLVSASAISSGVDDVGPTFVDLSLQTIR